MARNYSYLSNSRSQYSRTIWTNNLVLDPFISLLTLCISLVGIPSVMHTTKSSSASTASSIASAANGGGTNTPLALQFVSFLASATVLKTGTFRCFEPPFSGVTPPTILVLYSMALSMKSSQLP